MSTVTSEQKSIGDGSNPTLSYEDYLAKDYADVATEWVDGKVIVMAPVSDTHNQTTNFLISALGHFAEQTSAGVLRSEPFSMKTGPELPGRSPDVMLLRKENLGRLRKNHLQGPADLVIEVISPDSRVRDRGEKFYEYEQGGVAEYWLIDPERKQVEFYRSGDDGIFRAASAGADGVYHSTAFPGLWIKPAWLWDRPTVLDVIRAWGLISR